MTGRLTAMTRSKSWLSRAGGPVGTPAYLVAARIADWLPVGP